MGCAGGEREGGERKNGKEELVVRLSAPIPSTQEDSGCIEA